MDETEIRAILQRQGLAQYESQAYVTLLKHGRLSATELAAESGVPKARIYDVLRDLETEGVVETFEQDSLHAKAVDPEAFLTELKDHADELVSAADAIREMWEQPAVGDYDITLVKRPETVFEQARKDIRSAENEVQLSATPGQFDELQPVLREAKDRDVIVKLSLYTPDQDAQSLPNQDELNGVVSEARFRELPAPFLSLVDRTKSAFASHKPGESLGVLVNNYTLTYVFNWYFICSLWEVWDIVYSERWGGPPYRYVDARECIRDIAPLLEEEESIEVEVNGWLTASRDETTVRGRLAGIEYTERPDRELSLLELTGKATLVLESDGETVTIGSHSALEEDIEARRIIVHGPLDD